MKAFYNIICILTFILATGCWALQAQSGVTIAMSPNSLASLRYNGSEFLAYGDLRLNQLTFQTPGGQTIAGDLSGTSSVIGQRMTRTSSWGSITADYATSGNRLNATVTVNNRSPNTITSIWFEPFGLQFPSTVTEYNGSIPLIVNTTGGPGLQQTSYGTGVMVLAAEDVGKPLQLGFPWSFDQPQNRTFPLTFNTGRVSSLPDSYPLINRPIAPGASDSFTFSLRFGPSGSTLSSLAGDIYQKFAAAFPPTLHWPDRRAIGALFLSTASTGWATNPRGWLIDPTIDVTNAAGIANLKTRILAWADSSIAVLKSMNAQGMVTWDIEGQQYPHATSYVCDPTQFDTVAPEMSGIADAYFQKFRDAGLKVGVCLRPQQFVMSADRSSADQISISDPTQLLMNKVAYARNRWGATLFYVDSNVNATDPNPTDASVFQKLAAAFPDCLFMPEHSNLLYYAYTAPYRELRQGYTSTPADVRQVYPSSFTTIYTADGPIQQNFNALVTAVSSGDALLFRGWFDDPQNALDKSIYQQAGQGSPPNVSFSSPAAGSTVSDSITVAAAASAVNPISNIQFKLDGINLRAPVSAAPYQVTLDTRTLVNGPHTLAAVATDSLGNTGTASITISVSNVVAAPSLSITSPLNQASVSGTVNIVASTGGGLPISSVQFKLDNTNLGAPLAAAVYQVSLNTTTLTNGAHTIAAVATDSGGRTATASITVNVNNQIAITCPSPAVNSFTGCYYKDTSFTALQLVRADPQINFDWGLSSPDPSLPIDYFSVRWQGNFALTAGSYKFTLTSDDGSRLYIDGNLVLDGWGVHAATTYTKTLSLTSGVHLIRIDYVEQTQRAMVSLNWAAAASAPVVSITAPVAGAQLSGTVKLAASATSTIGITGLQFQVDGAAVGTRLTATPYTYLLDTTQFAKGVHTLSATGTDRAGASTTSVPFSVTIDNPTQSATCNTIGTETFFGCYYGLRDLTGLKFSRIDNQINFDWSNSTLAPGVGPENFSVRWRGNFTFQSGTYTFTVTTDDGSRLYVDGNLVLDAWSEHPAIPYSVTLPLAAGVHLIKLEYFQMGGNASAQLVWTKN